jgi:hypothetical protein
VNGKFLKIDESIHKAKAKYRKKMKVQRDHEIKSKEAHEIFVNKIQNKEKLEHSLI